MATMNILREHFLRSLLLIVFTGTLTATTLLLLTSTGRITLLTTVRETVQYQKCAIPPPPFSGPKQLEFPKNHHTAFYPQVFHPISKLETESTSTADWESLLLTPNGGFLMVSEAAGVVKGYGVSMFHQLHCLTMIRGMLMGETMGSEHEAQGEAWRKNPMHFLHCLDYMAQVNLYSFCIDKMLSVFQAIMCTADDTLEQSKPTTNYKGSVVDGIDGMGHTHQCRNASALWHVVADSVTQPRLVTHLGANTVFPE